MLQFVIRAPRDGQVEKIYYHVGENVSKDVVVVKFVKEGSDDRNAV
jgi:biotin carboxyl carrier protein